MFDYEVVIPVDFFARNYPDLSGLYTTIYYNLCEALVIHEPTAQIILSNIREAVEILIPDAAPELKDQARLGIETFIKDFASKTGLNVVELS